MNKVIKLVIALLLINCIFAAIKFTATDMHKLKRQIGTIMSPDAKRLVYSIRKWDTATGKISMHIEYVDMANKKNYFLTQPMPGRIDSNVQISEKYPNTVFFLSNRSGSNQLWSIELAAGKEPVQLTFYEVEINNLQVKADTAVFSAEVYFDCIELPFICTSQRNAEVQARGSNTWSVYTKMFVRHWDQWTTEGKGTHLFLTKLNASGQPENMVIDVMKGMEANSPVPPFGGSELFDISPNGSEVVFTAHLRTADESWSTRWRTYLFTLEENSQILLTEQFEGRTQNPKFSPDGKIITFLAMPRAGLESDNLNLVKLDRSNGVYTKISEKFDRSINDYVFFDSNTVFFIAMDWNANKIFTLDLTKSEDNVKKITEDLFSYSNIMFDGNNVVCMRSSFTTPDEIASFTYDPAATDLPVVRRLFNTNDGIIANFDFKDPEDFSFDSAVPGDKVQAFLFRPINFKEGNKYPLAVLIHGGPEGGFEAMWNFRWNPQIFASAGYVVLMMNPHGSSGQGIKFQDAVRNDWGGVPYEDLMLGVDETIKRYSFIDGTRACAAGASYGGYMVNWIQGHNTDRFKCLVTHDGVFSTLAMYYATEEVWFPHAEYCPLDQVGCKPWDEKYREGYLKHSPESLVKNWKTPHLIIHGSKDFRIPVSEGLSAFTALQVQGIDSKFLHFYEENHWVLKAENSVKWYDEVIGWFDKYTKTEVKSKDTNAFLNKMQYLE